MGDITVKFQDGSSHTYQGAPDSTSQVDVLNRVMKDFPEKVNGPVSIDGAKPSSFMDRLKNFATEGQIGPHGVLSGDLPQLLSGVADTATLGLASDKLPKPQTPAEQESRVQGRVLPSAIRAPIFPTASGKAMSFRPAIPTAAQLAKAKSAGAVPPSVAHQIMNSPVFKLIAKAAGISTTGMGGYELVKWLSSHLPS